MMKKGVHIIDPCTSDLWLRFVSDHPQASIFHHPVWMRMLRDTYDYKFFAVCQSDGENIVAGIPFADIRSMLTGKRWVSLPFSDFCRPLLPPDETDATEELVEYLRPHLGRDVPKIEIRWDIKTTTQHYADASFVHHTLALHGDADAVFKTFDKSKVQRDVRKAERDGIVVKRCSSLDDFLHFYRLQVTTRKRHGVPAQPLKFFKAVWEQILQSGFGFATLAYKDDRLLGGAVFFHFGKTMYYKYGASDFSLKALHPNHALLWDAIRNASTDGYTTFDFGRSEIENEGLRRFKNGWGTTESALHYTVFSTDAPKAGPSRMKGVMEAVIRNSPDFVCVLSGNVLYKHFA
ncbi:MAG: GNAT family N-acetyltransferase [Ignavibacteriae bacterium]|nr:GNAT family N-acetyltransferase [Ignavibacteriota bacterium]